MSESLFQELSKRERQIMNIIFKHGQADAQLIMNEIPDELTNSTVRTQLRILVNKGILEHRKEGSKFIYFPTEKKDSVQRSLLNSMLNTFFESSPYLAVTTMINENKEMMSSEELDSLEQMIKDLKKGSK